MLLYRKTIPFIFLMMLWQIGSAHTHDSLCGTNCGCHDRLTPAGIMLSHVHDRNQWMFSYRYMNMQMQGVMQGTRAITSTETFNRYLMSPEQMQMNMHMLMTMYGLTDRVTVMAMAGFTTMQMNMSMFAASTHHHNGHAPAGGHIHQMYSQGLGDLELHALFGLVKTNTHQLIGSVGVSLPVGAFNLEGRNGDLFYDHQRLPYNMQPGTGSFDLLPGLTYLYAHKNFSCAAQATGTWRTGANPVGYKWGNEISFNTWAAYNWWGFLGTSARLEATASGAIKGQDRTLYIYNEPAADPYNYGGKRVNVYWGLHFRAKNSILSNHLLAFEYGMPLYQNYNGIQMPLDQILNASWSITF